MIVCTGCERSYPQQGYPYVCPRCGGVYDQRNIPAFERQNLDPEEPGIWRYQSVFSLSEKVEGVSLGEGNTPLVWGELFGCHVGFKCEFLNPTGSFKDRGTTVLVSFLKNRGAVTAVEDSSGNAGASFAAYAARAKMRAEIFVPDDTSGPKRAQMAAYGARVRPVPGSRTNASQAALRAAQEGDAYASHVYMPFGLSGMATVAYELFEDLGRAPGTVVLPVGHGSLLLGLQRGFASLKEAGLVSRIPRMVAVQSKYYAPLWSAFQEKPRPDVGNTRASGVRILNPIRKRAILQAVEKTAGTVLAVEEDALHQGWRVLAGLGFHVEYTSALVWDAIRQISGDTPHPLVAILTGSGLKEPAS